MLGKISATKIKKMAKSKRLDSKKIETIYKNLIYLTKRKEMEENRK